MNELSSRLKEETVWTSTSVLPSFMGALFARGACSGTAAPPRSGGLRGNFVE
jgi:hypothetical protein